MNATAIEARYDIGTAIRKGLDFLVSRQEKNGCWKGDYGGPMFLPPMFIAACYITGQHLSAHEKGGFIEYYQDVQNADGSIGLHAEGAGCMFTTVLGYAALRILGLERGDRSLKKMRAWIMSNGTALGASSWGKFFMALLSLYPYEGLNPLLPELWALPYVLPFHPGRLWCHARQVYLPMSYLYGIRACVAENGLIREIRSDIYDTDYNRIDFTRYRNYTSPADSYRPYGKLLKAANRIQNFYEKHHLRGFRIRSLETVFGHVLYEDSATNYIDIGPVNSVLNTIVHYFREPGGGHFRKSFAALRGYLCEGHDGLKMNGYNSTALWDTAFAVQSICGSGYQDEYRTALDRAYDFIRDNQILEDVPERKSHFRHRSRGGWPFSDREHGWPITDCTAEGLKSEKLLRASVPLEARVPEPLREDAVRLILSFQNRDGGWATYEKCRGGKWLELLNPSSVFGDIMIDYSYVECTSSCLQALSLVGNSFDAVLNRRIENAIRRGARFIASRQRKDGGYEGSWAVCFTYGTWFAVWGLLAAGVPKYAPEIQNACRFLIVRQNEDGGWGEHYRSCSEGRWISHDESQAVNTSWALMTLVRAGWGKSTHAEKAAAFLVSRQMENGDWPRESLAGVFNKTALINYENYRRYFPVRALGLYAAHRE